MNQLQQAIALLGEAIENLKREEKPTMSHKAAVCNLMRASILSECALGMLEKSVK